MSAYSYLHHRMFVAALGNDPALARPSESRDAWPTGAASQPEVLSRAPAPATGRPLPGMLLANALLNGYRPTVS